MTVRYSSQVATATRGFGFSKLLFRWKGSIYKAVWINLVFYVAVFFLLSYVYRQILDRPQQKVFEQLSRYCRQYMGMIPLSFILGFYVDIVMVRWWGQLTKIPYPDGVGLAVITSVKGTNEQSRLIRRTIMRYVNLSFVITLQLVSPTVKERFPTWDHLVDAGFLIESEREIIEHLADRTGEPKYWLPLVWAANVAARARKQDKIYDDVALNFLVKEINEFETGCQELICYDWICIPIVYTQAVTLACYLYFTCAIMARQVLLSSEFHGDQTMKENEFDILFPVVPIFLFIEFFFYMGWLNVAEILVNPFGQDDDDFEVNWFIDRHFQTSMVMVDGMLDIMPAMAEDLYWAETGPVHLPHTPASLKTKMAEPFQGSAAAITVSSKQANFVVELAPEISIRGLERQVIQDDFAALMSKAQATREPPSSAPLPESDPPPPEESVETKPAPDQAPPAPPTLIDMQLNILAKMFTKSN